MLKIIVIAYLIIEIICTIGIFYNNRIRETFHEACLATDKKIRDRDKKLLITPIILLIIAILC